MYKFITRGQIMKKKVYPLRCLIFLVIIAPLTLTKTLPVAWAKVPAPCLSTLWPHEKSDLLPDPDLIFGKLPNGIRYVLMENHEPKDRVSLHLNVQAGSLNESDDQQGLAHFLEHMLFNGSEHFPPGELVKYFQSIGMAFGNDANAHTGFAETVYDVLLPTGSKENIEKGLLVMKDYARGALLLKSEIDRERGIILAEKRTRNSVGYRTYISSMKFVFSGSKITQRLPIGIEEVITKADRRLLKDYYDAWYRPENMILIMAGDFDAGLAESLIKSAFSEIVPDTDPQACPDMGKVQHEGIKTFYHFEEEAGNTRTSVQVVWNTEPKPDSLSFQKEILTQYIADSIMNNRLEAMIEKPDNPFTSATIYSGVFLNRLGYAKLSARSAPENWKDVLALLEQSLRQAIAFGFSASELDRVRKDFLADMDAAVLEKDTRDSSGLSSMIIDNLNDDKVFQSPEQDKALYAPFIKSLTVPQVNDAFASLWDRNHRLILVTGNAHIKDKTPETVIRAVFDESAKKEVTAPVREQTVRFPYLPEPETPGQMLQRTEIFDLGIEQIDFENGVRLNLKKTDFKKNEVVATINFGFGRKTEPLPGLAILAESVINKSGLGGLTRNELDRALAGKKTGAWFDVKEGSFMLRGETISEEIPLLFQLLYACFRDPGYREEAYSLVMQQFEQRYKRFSHSVEGAMILFEKRFLTGGDTRFGLPPYETFQKLTLAQVREWIEPLRNSRLEISVVGDFDPETVKNLAARYFGSLPPQKEVQAKKESLEFPAGENLTIRVKTTIDKGKAVIAWPTEDFSDIQQVRRLSVLGHVFADRLREEIREKLGATYSQYAYNKSSRTYKGYGVFRSVLSIDPEMAEKIVTEVRRIASDLATKGVTQDELSRAIKPVLTSIKDMMRTNKYWLNTVLNRSVRRPEQLDWSRSIQKDYAAITVQDISELAKIYLDNEKAATVIIVPDAEVESKDISRLQIRTDN